MKSAIVVFSFILFSSSIAFAQGEFICSALCGVIQPEQSSTQGLYWTQMMASGADAPTAFANLQAKCQAIADRNPNMQPPVALYIGFDAENNQGVFGQGFPATQDNACISL